MTRHSVGGWVRRRARHDDVEVCPLALPDHLADVPEGLLVVRPGPAGPDIADLNRTASGLLGDRPAALVGLLLSECPRLSQVTGLQEAVARVTRGSLGCWRATLAGTAGPVLELTVSRGPTPDSALLQLLSARPDQAPGTH